MPLDDVLFDTEDKMDKALDFLRQELRGVRTGRATPGLVDSLRVEVESYGSTMTLKELASIAVTEGNVIVVKPFDPGTLKDIQRSIEKSELGINPQNDGKMIRLPVPALSGDRRQKLIARVKELGEQQKISVRNIRRDANKALETEKKAKTLPEDDADRGQEQVQKLTDEYCKKIDAVVDEKSKEIQEV
ncbi:MAG: ribosome recycling factor [Phycisphaerales bacterium]|nr:ribosome recycling factor [Phycisphaerales bacterium]